MEQDWTVTCPGSATEQLDESADGSVTGLEQVNGTAKEPDRAVEQNGKPEEYCGPGAGKCDRV